MANNNTTKKNNATMRDLMLMAQAGLFNQKTGLPYKYGTNAPPLKDNIRKLLRVQDEQDAVNRFTWYNLPDITGQELERLLYYKGQICMFYNETLNKYFYLPFALDGEIDVYGRFLTVHPVPMGSTNAQNEDAKTKALGNWLSTIKLDVIYDIPKLEEMASLSDTGELIFNFSPLNLTKKTAILYDYTPQLSQTIVSRQMLNEGLIDVESDCIPFMRTALLNGTGVRGMRVTTEADAANVFAASEGLNQAALAGQKFIPIVGMTQFQDFTSESLAHAEEFLLAMQSLDNLRLGTYGLENGGLFQKKAHELQAEAAMNGGNTNLILQDSLAQRQRFCNRVNAETGLGIWCEISETASGLDKNLDGEVSDEQDGQEMPVDNAAAADEGGQTYE